VPGTSRRRPEHASPRLPGGRPPPAARTSATPRPAHSRSMHWPAVIPTSHPSPAARLRKSSWILAGPRHDANPHAPTYPVTAGRPDRRGAL